MSDLIDRNALRDKMYHEAFETDTPDQKWDGGCWIRYKMFERNIENAPTIDAVPARRGRWVHIENEYYDDFFRCSECGLIRIVKDGRAYCERCGAKMDGGEKDG